MENQAILFNIFMTAGVFIPADIIIAYNRLKTAYINVFDHKKHS